MTYPAHLYRECEQRTVKESAAKVAKANRPRNQTVTAPPSNTKAAPIHTRMGLAA